MEVDESLAAMFQTAEVRPWMLQLLLWHPEKWETQDVGAKSPPLQQIRELFLEQTQINFTVTYPSADNA